MTTTFSIRRIRPRAAAKAAALAGSLAMVAALGTSAPANAGGSADAHRGFPTFAKGVVVRAGTGAAVGGVLVSLRDPVSLDLIASDVTDAMGRWRVDGLSSDEYGIKYNGSRRGYETGWLGCAHNVVPTWGQACSFAPGNLGKAWLDKL